MFDINRKRFVFVMICLLAACTSLPKPPAQEVAQPPVVLPPAPAFAVSKWEMLPDWQTLNLAPSQPAFLQSCRVLKAKLQWQQVCTQAEGLPADDSSALRAFYEEWFTPYQVFNSDGSEQGMITGYYEPLLMGSRVKTQRFYYPLYAVPDDMLTIDLSEVYPQLKDFRLRGRLQGKRVVPYYNRAEIDSGTDSLQGRELFWVENAVELFFFADSGVGANRIGGWFASESGLR